MSQKGIEVISNKKQDYANMSERQALLYLQHLTTGKNEKNPEQENVLLDYHQYWRYKKQKNANLIDKETKLKREQLIKLSEKQFSKINQNIYYGRKKYAFTDDDAFICNCNPKKYTSSEAKKIIESHYENKHENELFGCGNNCVNNQISWECVEHLCPCKASCRNRKFQNHEYADVYPIKTENRGWGLCAGSLLKKGTFVIQYIGEVYSLDSKYGQKKLKEYKNKLCTYLMSLSKNEVIDPTEKGNFARFINHSCEPNCETQKWNVLGEVCIGIFTLRDIQPDEELTFNYGFDIFKTTFQQCLCGAPSCKGYLGVAREDIPREINYKICDICNLICKTSDFILVCDNCKKVFHKKCAKKDKGDNMKYICLHCIKKEINKKHNEENKEKIKIEGEPIYDEYYEVGDDELRKIRKNLPKLIFYGARLFWDFQQQNMILGTNNKIDVKITGTTKQIENVKKMIKQLEEDKTDENNTFITQLQIPKIFVRKIIGHQNINLNSYKSKYNVDIEYDSSLITDEIFPIQDSTQIEIKGKENNVKIVEKDIKSYLYNLKVLSIFLMPTDYQFIRSNICNLKTKIDPADARLRRRENKSEKDFKHPFYYISNNNRDIVIIGFEKEVEKAGKLIKDILKIQNSLNYNYSLSFLLPSHLQKQVNNFIENNKSIINSKKLYVNVIAPQFLRKHLNVYLEGKWNDVIDFKNLIWNNMKELKFSDLNLINQRKYDLLEFEQYAFNQEHKLISKSIKNYIIEQNPQIKNWDNISIDIDNINTNDLKDEDNLGLIHSRSSLLSSFKFNDERNLINKFITTCDKETKLNYLLNSEPGAYNRIFNMNQNNLITNLYSLVSDLYESYKDSKIQGNSGSESKDNLYINNNSFKNEKEHKDNINSNFKPIIQKDWSIPQNDQNILSQMKNMSPLPIPQNSYYPQLNSLNLMSIYNQTNNFMKNINKNKTNFTSNQNENNNLNNIINNTNNPINSNNNQLTSNNPINTNNNQLNTNNPTNTNNNQINNKKPIINTEQNPLNNNITNIISNHNLINNNNNNHNVNDNYNEQKSVNDPLKISYNFSDIKQMNINININNEHKNYINNNLPNNTQIEKKELKSPQINQQKYSSSNYYEKEEKNISQKNDDYYLRKKLKRDSSYNREREHPKNSPPSHHYHYYRYDNDYNSKYDKYESNKYKSKDINSSYYSSDKRRKESPIKSHKNYYPNDYNKYYEKNYPRNHSNSSHSSNNSLKKYNSHHNFYEHQYNRFKESNSFNRYNNNINEYSSYGNDINLKKYHSSRGKYYSNKNDYFQKYYDDKYRKRNYPFFHSGNYNRKGYSRSNSRSRSPRNHSHTRINNEEKKFNNNNYLNNYKDRKYQERISNNIKGDNIDNNNKKDI